MKNVFQPKVIPGAAGTYHCVQNNGAGSVASAEVIVMGSKIFCENYEVANEIFNIYFPKIIKKSFSY